jgi:hypothetical protein
MYTHSKSSRCCGPCSRNFAHYQQCGKKQKKAPAGAEAFRAVERMPRPLPVSGRTKEAKKRKIMRQTAHFGRVNEVGQQIKQFVGSETNFFRL